MIQYTRLQCKFPFCIMVYILPHLINIVIINIPKFAFSILKMQYFSFKQAVQTRQPEHCAKQTNQRQKRRKETTCGQSPSKPYLSTVRQCVRVFVLRYESTFSSHECGRKRDVSAVWQGSHAALLSITVTMYSKIMLNKDNLQLSTNDVEMNLAAWPESHWASPTWNSS